MDAARGPQPRRDPPVKVHTYVREHSVRCPGKNLRYLGGEPLWRRTLRRYADHDVYLDTDSEAVLESCRTDPELFHVTAYPRAHEHRIREPGLGMTWRFLEEHVPDADEPVALVHVTSPFLDPIRVETAWGVVADGRHYDSAASVTEIQDYCYRTGRDGYPVPLNHDGRRIPGTQKLEKVWHLNHAFFVFSRRSLERWNHRVGERCLFVPLPFPESLDIDHPEDFRMAEAVLAAGIAP